MWINLLCVTHEKAREIMKEVHDREYGPHINDCMLTKKVQWMGYFWSTTEADCYAYVRRCHKCQVRANLKQQ